MKIRLTILLLLAALAILPNVALAQEQPPQDPNAPPAAPEQQPPPAPEQETPAEQAVPPPAQPPAVVTLGTFVMKLASGMKLQAPPSGFTPESAAWALVLKGVKVRPDLTSPVTEADAVNVLSGLGYKIRTTTPSRVMTSDRVDILLETFIPPDRS